MGKIVLTLGMLFIALMAKSQKEQPLVRKGNELYKKQQYDKAADEYQKATALNDKNVKAQLNLGNALYKSKKPEEAQKAYETAAENAKDTRVKSKALYNEGVNYSRQNKLAESIVAYKQTLRINPADEEARQNLQKALNELKKNPPPQPKNEKKDQNKNQDKKQPQEPKNNSKLNKKKVEQMLNALRQDEKKLQQNIQKRNNVGGANTKDW